MIKQQYFSSMIFVLFVLLFVSLSTSLQQSNPLKQFNVTPDSIYLNWTNNYTSNITITINETFNNITIEILNSTSVTENYTQGNDQNYCTNLYKLYVRDTYGNYTNIIGPLNATNSSNITIIDNVGYNHLGCKPGRYWIEKFTIRNSTQTNETANITVYIDIPISITNNADILSTGIGRFYGQLPINSTTYQSFYFNTSLVPNATGIKINLTGWLSSQDIDLFLFDNSTTPILMMKSINKTHTVESLLYNYLPSIEKTWEIRVYGNSTSAISYSGMMIFTTLNVTNSSLNFSVMNASELKQVEITLRNEGNLTLSNVAESKELYRIHKFGGNGTRNFTFFVPDSSIATKVKISLNWTGSSNYSFNLYNPSNSIIVSSANKYVYANVTGVMQEEYNETTNISTAGIWKVEVKDNSASNDPYNLTVFVHVNTTNWFRTNYTTMTFNRTGNANYTCPVQINFTVQNNSMDGLYEGYIQYLDVNSAGIKIPILINVTTPMLVINNTLNFTTITIDENYGTNLTRTLNVYVNNTGSYGLNVVITNSSNGTMTCVPGTGCSSGYANFSYNSITSISNRSSQTLNVNITYNSSMSPGLYSGWILFNAMNTSVTLTSHPYETFNLTLRLNLTNLLDVRVQEVKSTDGDTWTLNSSVENATAEFKIYYVNGTAIESQNSLNTSNFTVWLTHVNVTSYRIPTSGGLSIYNGTNPIYNGIDPFYRINFTVPANIPGGQYSVHVMANYTKNPSYGGEGSNQTLIINNTGLKLTALTTTSFSFYEGESAEYLNISVINYGPINPGGSITMDDWTNATITAYWANDSCISGQNERSFTFTASDPDGTIGANGTETCVFSWKIQPASSVSSDTEVSNLKILATDANFSGIENIYILVQDNTTTTTTVPSSSSSSSSSSTSNASSKVSGTTDYLNIVDYPSSISIEQGGSKKVGITVNNTNKTLTQNMIVSVIDINSSWYSVNPSTAVKLKRGASYTFEVTFNIPNNASIGDYSAKFNATSVYINPTKPDVSFIYDTVLKSFTLKVTPGEALKSEINTKLSQYKNDMNSLDEQINQSKNKNYNTSEVESLLDQLSTKISQANSYVSNGDYSSAYNLLDGIASLINQTESALINLNPITGQVGEVEGDWWSWGKWVVIVVVVIVSFVLGYMLWPTKPGETKPTPKTIVEGVVEGKKDKITETFAKLKERWKEIREKRKES